MLFTDALGLVTAVIVVVVPFLILFQALRQHWRRHRAPTARAVGLVVGVAQHNTGEGVVYLSQVEFTDVSGVQRRFTDDVGSSWQKPRAGTEVSVFYPISDPDSAWIPHPISRSIGWIMLLGFVGYIVFLLSKLVLS